MLTSFCPLILLGRRENRLDQFVFPVLELMVWQGAEGDARVLVCVCVCVQEGPFVPDIVWPHRHLLRRLLFIWSLVPVYLACRQDS